MVGTSADGSRRAFGPRTLPVAVLLVLTTLCALVIDCTTVHHDDHHAGTVAVVAGVADVVVPDHPLLPDHCLADVAAPDSALVLPALAALTAVLLVLVAALGLPALAGRGPPRVTPRSRPGRDILIHHCLCRR